MSYFPMIHCCSTWELITIEVINNESSSKYRFVYHKSSQELYNDDSLFIIRVKCILLFLSTPLFRVITSFDVLSNAFSRRWGLVTKRRKVYDCVCVLVTPMFEWVRSLIYIPPLCLSALMGIVFPYQGRHLYGMFERKLNKEEKEEVIHGIYLAICFQYLEKIQISSKTSIEKTSRLARFIMKNYLEEGKQYKFKLNRQR